MAKDRGKRKPDRRDPGHFIGIPVAVMQSAAYRALGSSARALMLDIASQYVGGNNGRLLAGWTFMSEERGWRSKHTVVNAKNELIACGALVVETRIGKFPSTSAWYACVWWPLDWCPEMEMSLATFPRSAYRNALLGAVSAQERPRTGAVSAQGEKTVGAVSAPVRPSNAMSPCAETAQHLETPSSGLALPARQLPTQLDGMAATGSKTAAAAR